MQYIPCTRDIHYLSSQDGTPKPPEAKKAKKPAWKYVDLPIISVTASATKKALVDLREVEVRMYIVQCSCRKYYLSSVGRNSKLGEGGHQI